MKIPSIVANNSVKLLSGLGNNDDCLAAMIAKDWIGDAATVYTYKKEGGKDDAREKAIEEFGNANSHFDEVQQLAKKDEHGNIVGIWGAMSDFTRSFKPWEDNFSKGLYLAGVECDDNAEAPEGWTKWIVPSYEYIYAECEGDNTFGQVINYISQNDITLVGAVHDFTCPETGKNYMFFPIRSI